MTTEDCLLQRDLLIEESFGLVHHMAKQRFRHDHELDYDERVGIGSVALIKAVRSYDPVKNKNYSSYVCRCVDNALKNAYRDTRKYAHDISTEDMINVGRDNQVMLMDMLYSDSEPDQEAVEKVTCDVVKDGIHQALSTLDERGQYIIKRYFGIDCEQLSQHGLSRDLGYSQTYIRKLINKYMDQLKSVIDGDLIHYL